MRILRRALSQKRLFARSQLAYGQKMLDFFHGIWYNLTSLTGISIPDSVTSIYYDTFANCTSLTSVTIGNGVEQIFRSAFYGCESLKEINYYGTVEQWKTIEIANKPFAKSAVSVVHCTDGNVRINK